MTKQIIDVYPNFGNSWKLELVYRDDNGDKKREEIKNFTDYFYVGEDKVGEITKYPELKEQVILIEEVKDKKALFYDGKIYKVHLKGIWSKFKFMKYFGGNLTQMFELDVSAEMRYAIDNIKQLPKTNYKTLYFDIETSTDNGFPDWENAIEKITCITCYDSFTKKFISYILRPDTWEEKWLSLDETQFKGDVKFYDDEKKMLLDFIRLVEDEDYDIMTAWNISFDLSYIFGRCDKLGIPKTRFSPYGKVEIKKKMNKQQREELYVSINGRFIIDLLERYKAITFKEIPSYSLEYVSELELGKQEKKERVLDFSKEWRDKLDKLIIYSIKDVELLVVLDNKLKLIDYLEELRLINNMPNIQYASIAKHLIDMSLFREYGSSIIFPSKSNLEKVNMGGGYLKEPKTGVYNWVAVYDFAGLYPSLIRTFNLSKDTIVDEKEADFITFEDDVAELPKDIGREGFKTGWTLQHKGMIPTVLEKIINLRKQIKKEMKGLDKNSIEYREKDIKQYALKAPINANYGVNSYPGFRLYEPRVAATITYLGRKISKYCSKRIEQDFNLKVLYNDTDSLFVEIKENNEKLMNEIKEKINSVYVKDFVSEVTNGKAKENYIEIEFEKTFEKILLIKKRRYLGRTVKGDWIYKGVDLKRSNTPEIIKLCLQHYLERLFEGEEDKKCILSCRKILNQHKNELELFQIPLKLSKEYTSNLPQKRASEWANKYLKTNYKQGSKFYGIWTSGQFDIIGFSHVKEVQDIAISVDMDKYNDILVDKLNNLRETDIGDISQTTLF
jgi:DNA polymerase elongation subunit (family B)